MNNESKEVKDSSFQKLEYDDALDIMQNYGYSSAAIHPYIYQNGDDLGICYSYVDAEYGSLERIKLFETAKELDDYLKQMKWLETNGPLYHIRMALDNYETVYPRILFLRNERIMVPSEMEDIETYDYNNSKRADLDDTTKILYEAGDLLLVYDEIKARQLAYIKNLTVLKNTLRQKYYELQLEVDKYNRIGKIERHLSTVPETTDTGIDISLEINIKDRYNQYVAQKPEFEEAVLLIKDSWDMCKALELNSKYYEVQIEDNNIRNEIKLVEAKLALMKELNDDVKPLFGVDLVAKFRKINKEFLSKNNEISNEYINSQLAIVDKKYSVFDQLDVFDASEYLKEAISNSNLDDLVRKYAKGRVKSKDSIVRLPLNEVASNLTVQFKEKLTQQEQSVLVLHNNAKFRQIFDAILNTPDYENMPIKKLIKVVKKIHGFSKIKSDCYDILKKKLEDPINANVKASMFSGFDFTSFETFISSIVWLLNTLKNINEKMVLNSDVNMYMLVKNPEEIRNNKFTFITNDINTMYIDAQSSKSLIALILVKKDTPVLYSPYTFDLGDLYIKNGNQQVFIKETIGFDLLVENADLDIHIDDNKVNVVNYQSEKEVSQNLTTAVSLDSKYKQTFCKLVFRDKKDLMTLAQTAPIPVQTAAPAPATTPVDTQVVLPVVPAVTEAPAETVTPVVEEKPTTEFKSANDIIKDIAGSVKPEEKKEVEEPKPVEKKEEVKPTEEKKEEVVVPKQLEEPKVEEKKEEPKPEVKKEEVKVEEKTELPKPIEKKEELSKPVEAKTEVKPEPVKVDKPVEKKVIVKDSISKPVEPVKKEEVKVEPKPAAQPKPVEQPKPVVQPKPAEKTELPKVAKTEEKKVETVKVPEVKVEEKKVEVKPTEVKSVVKKEELPKVEQKPVQAVKPAEAKPVTTTPVEKKEETKVVTPKIVEAKPQEVKVEAKPVPPKAPEAKPEEKKVEPVKPVEKKEEVKSAPSKPAVTPKTVEQPKPVAQPKPVENKPVQQVSEVKEKEEKKNEGNV